MDGITGEIRIFTGPFAPLGWLACDGSSLDRNRFPNLFNVINFTYGGSGNQFNLPDLRGRAPIGMSGTQYPIGSKGGATTYRIDNIPKHNHQLFGVNKPIATAMPANALTGNFNSRDSYYATAPVADKTLNPLTVYPTGKENIGPSLNNEQPFIAVNYIICWEGQFPY